MERVHCGPVGTLAVVLALDVALCLAFDVSTGQPNWRNKVVLLGLARSGVNVLVLFLSLRWGMVNKHIQAEGLAAAYSVLATPEFKRPLIRTSSFFEETPEMRAYRERRRAELWRTLFLAIAFLTNTCVTFYIALRCIYIDFVSNRVQPPILFSMILVSSCEFYFLKNACDAVTRVKGHLIESLHLHKLYFWPKLALHSCDVCLARIGGKGYRCKRCDFDVCQRCFATAIRLEESSSDYSDNESEELRSEDMDELGLHVVDEEDEEDEDAGTRGRSTLNSNRLGGSQSSLLKAKARRRLRHRKEFHAMRALSWNLLRPHWVMLTVSFFCLLGFALARIGLPNYQGNILDSVFEKSVSKFHTQVLLLAVCSVVLVVFGMVRDACISIVGRRIATQVRNMLFSAILFQDLDFFDRMMSGHLTASLTNDVNAMVGPWKSMLTNMLSNIFVIAGGMVMCLYTSWRLTAISLTTLLPMAYVASIYTKWSTQINREIWSGISDANSVATEAIANIRTVKGFAMEKKEIERFIAATNNALGKGERDALGTAITNGLTQHLSVVGTVLVLGFGGWEALNHPDTLSPGELVTFQLYWTMVNTAYKSISDSMNDVSRAMAAAQRVLEMLAKLDRAVSEKEDKAKKEFISIPEEQPVKIEFHNVSFAYPSNPNTLVLQDMSVEIEPNAVTVLAGRSGAGKSTFFNLLCRFYDPIGGYITVNDQPFDYLELSGWRKQLGLVSQDVPLFGLTILENLVYGLDPDSYSLEDVVKAAEDAHAHSFIMKMKYGYQTRLGERGVQCSLGEKARLSIARALLRKPKVLLLDEPTANLDPESQHLVQEGIQALLHSRNSTVILITHKDSQFVQQYAKRIFVFEAGTIVEQGTYQELTSNPESLYFHLFRKSQAMLNSSS